MIFSVFCVVVSLGFAHLCFLETLIEYLMCTFRSLTVGIQWGIALAVSAHCNSLNLTELALPGRNCVCVDPSLCTQGPNSGTESCPGDDAEEIDLGSFISVGLPILKTPKHIPQH